jgi:hypothetical protein
MKLYKVRIPVTVEEKVSGKVEECEVTLEIPLPDEDPVIGISRALAMVQLTIMDAMYHNDAFLVTHGVRLSSTDSKLAVLRQIEEFLEKTS